MLAKSMTVKKIWKDENNQDGKRPASIAVDVYANGQKLADKTVTVTGGSTDAEWTAQTTDLPIFDTNGQKITYTIGEDQLDGYDAPESSSGESHCYQYSYARENRYQSQQEMG